MLANPDAGVVVEFSLGGFEVGLKGGRDLVEAEAFEDGTIFSVVVVTGLIVALFSVEVFVFVGSGLPMVVTTSLLFESRLWSFEVTSSPPARSREEASKITSKANILRTV